MNNDKRYQIYADFQKRFPLEKLPEMTLEEYTNLERNDSFCYWIESKTNSLGSFWGGSSFKFGIYRYKERPNSRKIVSDDKYAWYRFYDVNSAEEAFALVKDSIIRVANAARNGNIDDIYDIDKIKVLGTAYKWKIAFLYSDMRLLPIYKLDYLRIAATLEGINEAYKLSPATIQLELYKKRGHRSVMDYYDELIHKVLSIVRTKKKTINEADAIIDEIFETPAVHEPEIHSKQHWWLVANPKYWSF
ncbi:MAG: hypothetical protein K2M00_00260, partial [Muribaculaceae bacterium]|nr:hypothetical protein [Muribaculaceae bacterium]